MSDQYSRYDGIKISPAIHSIDELGLFWAYQHCEYVYQLTCPSYLIALAYGNEPEEVYCWCDSWENVCDVMYDFEYGLEKTEALHYEKERAALLSIPMRVLYYREYKITT